MAKLTCSDWREKLKVSVKFPIRGLDLTKHALGQSRAVYDLYAMSCHIGTLSHGHYTAYAKNAVNKQWYFFDDANVAKVDEDEVSRQNVGRCLSNAEGPIYCSTACGSSP